MFLRSMFKAMKGSGRGADSMLYRELIADVIQNSLKITAYTMSGSQAMKAELMRAMVDCVNHVSLFFVNKYSARPPDAQHNYGYERYKNLVAFLPSGLFFCSGIYNVVMPVYEMLETTVTTELSLTGPSLFVNFTQMISLCSFGEFYLFYKNLGDIDPGPVKSIPVQFARRVVLAIKVLGKWHPADSIQVVVISENVTSVLGMSLPLFTSFVAYFTGWNFLDMVGGIMNGSVQLYLASRIFWDNTQVLIGKSLAQSEMLVANMQKIKSFVEDKEGVHLIEDIKSEYISTDKVKIAAKVKFNLQEITQNIITEMEPDIRAATSDPLVQVEVRKLLEKSVGLMLTYTTEIIQDIEREIKRDFPYVSEIGLEQSLDNINKDFERRIPLTTDEESTKSDTKSSS